ncbi:MAG TPA: hypothetical protein VEZ12_20385, partial [Herpetosiphonaceae bacterium]|nr:hypothetical protein [Herpetosiphonaceae bacterium]
MPHSARMRRMVELGRQARTDAGIVTLLDELAGGDFYSRSLAVQSCYGSGDGKRALRALDDPSAGIRTHTISLVALVCDDDEVRAALAKIPRERRPGMIKALWRRRRRGLIDELIEVLAAHHEADLAALLRWGSVELVRRRLAQVEDVMNGGDWRALARLHPQLAAEALRFRAQQAEQLDQRLLEHANAALPELAREAPDEAILLVRALLRHASPSQLALQRLAERRPAVMADLLATVDHARISFTRIAYRLDIDRLLRLIARHTEMLRDPELWLGRLRPEQRAAVADLVLATSRDRDGCIARPLLVLLPHVTREAEGRRHLQLPA